METKERCERPEGGDQEDRHVVLWTGITFPCKVTGILAPVGTFDMQKEIGSIQHL
jgi:hypothetical protein